MIVVSDTTAVTTLLKARMEDLLRVLFGSVRVPQTVWDELSVFHTRLPDFIAVDCLAEPDRLLPQTSPLGRGESEAITLAKLCHADILLLDDLKARQIATDLGIKCVGLLGLLIRAKQLGHIPSLRECIAKLETQGGLYLSDKVKNEALRMAGEF